MQNFYKFELKEHTDNRGTLVPLVDKGLMPFEVKRIYYILNSPPEASRAKLAHKSLEQVLLCVSGSCKVLLDNGSEKNIIELKKYNEALYINKGIWREIFDFSSDCVLLSLNSENCDEDEIIRDYDEFLKFNKKL